jgi:hypothetical protein
MQCLPLRKPRLSTFQATSLTETSPGYSRHFGRADCLRKFIFSEQIHPPPANLANLDVKKVNLSFSLINWALFHEDVWGSGGTASPFLTTAVGGGEWSASRPRRFIHGERARGTHWIGGRMGPRAGLDAVEKRKISRICRKSNHGRSASSPIK